MLLISKVKGKAFRMFDLKQENKVIAFVKRNPGLVAVIGYMVLSFLMPEAAYADLAFLGTKLKGKITDVSKVLNTAAASIAGIGFVWFIVTFFRGEPHYKLGGLLIAGSVLLALSGQITGWLAN